MVYSRSRVPIVVSVDRPFFLGSLQMTKKSVEPNPVINSIKNKNPQISGCKKKSDDHGQSKIEMDTDKEDRVPYYNQGYEAIKYIESWDMTFSEGNIIKYVSRYKFKGKPLEDLKKARYYLDRLIDNLDKKTENK